MNKGLELLAPGNWQLGHFGPENYAGEGLEIEGEPSIRELSRSTTAEMQDGQDKDLFRLYPKNDGNPRLGFKPGGRVGAEW